MSRNVPALLHRSVFGAALAALILGPASPSEARVTRIEVDTKASPAFGGQSFGAAGQYETLAGRAFGELDPKHPLNAIIQDIELAPKNAKGHVEYMATFFVVKPIDMSKSSRLMWHDVPNRGGRLTLAAASRAEGDIGLSSGWQGDNSGATVPGPDNDYVMVPVAKNPDGSAVTGLVMGRIVNASGVDSQAMFVHTQSRAVQAGVARYQEGDPDHTCVRDDRGDIGETANVEHRLGVGELQCHQPVPGHAGPHANLPQERLRSQAAVSGRLHGQGPLRARHRLRRVS